MMGTHGRNAITINGIHMCNEQTMDGHEAADDLTYPFLIEGKIPNIQYPTMKNKTSECNQETFAHIDYDKRILYTSWLDPKNLLILPDEEIYDDFLGNDDPKELVNVKDDWKNQISNIKKLEKQGWSIIFDTYDCPEEYGCCNNVKYKKFKINQMKQVLNAMDSFVRTVENVSDKEDKPDTKDKPIIFPRFIINMWRKEVLNQTKLIDPDNELHWESLATGWAIAKNIKPEDAIEFGWRYMEFDNDLVKEEEK